MLAAIAAVVASDLGASFTLVSAPPSPSPARSPAATPAPLPPASLGGSGSGSGDGVTGLQLPRTRLLSRSKPVRPTALVCAWSFAWAVGRLGGAVGGSAGSGGSGDGGAVDGSVPSGAVAHLGGFTPAAAKYHGTMPDAPSTGSAAASAACVEVRACRETCPLWMRARARARRRM